MTQSTAETTTTRETRLAVRTDDTVAGLLTDANNQPQRHVSTHLGC
jgi:hypothetical protein